MKNILSDMELWLSQPADNGMVILIAVVVGAVLT